jgi:hypothetical protein
MKPKVKKRNPIQLVGDAAIAGIRVLKKLHAKNPQMGLIVRIGGMGKVN